MKKKVGIIILILVIVGAIVFGIWIAGKPSNQEENVEINLKGLSFENGSEGEPCEVKLFGKIYTDSTNSKYFDVRLAGYQEEPDKGGVWIDGEKTDLMTLVISNNGEEFTVSGSTLTDDEGKESKLKFAADADLEFLIICSYDEKGEIERLIVTPAETKDDALKLIDELLPKVIGELNIQTVEEWKEFIA